MTFSESMAFLDARRLQRGLIVQGGLRVYNTAMQFQVIDHSDAPIVIGGGAYLVAAKLLKGQHIVFH